MCPRAMPRSMVGRCAPPHTGTRRCARARTVTTTRVRTRKGTTVWSSSCSRRVGIDARPISTVSPRTRTRARPRRMRMRMVRVTTTTTDGTRTGGGETTRGRDESDVGSDRRRGDGYSWRRGNESGCERAPPSADCSRARRSTRWSARLGRRRRVGDSFYEVNNDRCNVYRRVRRARFGCRRLAASRSRRRGRRLRNRRATSDEGEASSWALITKSADERSGDCDVAGAMRFACEIT